MFGNLLTEPYNPAALMTCRLESILTDAFKPCIHVPSPMLLPGCQSFAYLVDGNEVDGYTRSNCAEGEESMAFVGKRESHDKFDRQMLIHGIESSGGEIYRSRGSSLHQLFLPMHKAAVYLLLLVQSLNESVTQSADVKDEPKKVSVIQNIIKEAEEASYHPDVDLSNVISVETDQTSQVYHHMVSLLENVPVMCGRLISSSVQCISNEDDKLMEGAVSESNKDCNCSPVNLSQKENASPQFLESLPCLITAGQCMLPGPICKTFTPVKLELMIVHQIPVPQHVKMQFPSESRMPFDLGANCSHLTFLNNISANVISALNSSSSLSQNINISLQPCVSLKIILQGVDHCVITNRVFLQSQDSNDSDTSLIGYTIFVCIGDHSFHISLINVSNFTCKFWGIEDERLLWCTEEKFLSQFQFDASRPIRILKPPSLYPLAFAHDISFWEKDGSVFNISGFYNIIRNIAGDLVIQVSLVDIYLDPVTRCRSQCYRLNFQSCFQALTYQTSWKLQSRIRMKVAKTLGVTLR